MVAAETRTLKLTIEIRGKTFRPFRREELRVKKVVLAEGESLEVDKHKVKKTSMDGSSVHEGIAVRSIMLLPEGPILRTEFQGTKEEPVDEPLIQGEISVIRKGVFQTTTITG